MRKIINKIASIPKQIVDFISQVFVELRKVDWLSRKKTLRYTTIIVIAIVAGVVLIMALDKIFLELRNLIIK